MKTKQNTAGLILLICTSLALGYCANKDDPGPGPISDEDAVTQAKDNLAVDYAQGDSEDSVTEDVTLSTAGADGVSITWASSNDAVIDVETTAGTGTVTRPDDMNTKVTLTATLTKGTATDTATFSLTVIISASGADTAAVTQAKDNLAVDYVQGDSESSVTEDVTLPATGADGVSISWESSNTGIISTAGVVTRHNDMNTDVRLTATLTKNAASDMKVFTLTVLISDDGQAVMQAKTTLTISYASGAVRVA